MTHTYVYDDADKLEEITSGGVPIKEYTYDDAGRTTSVVTSAGTTSLTYDYEGRITQVTYPNSSTNTFTYNGLDTRVSKVDSTGTKNYLRDGAYVTDPVINDGAAGYTPGISERRSGTTKFMHTDRLGTTERLTNTSQSTTDTREYDAFGLLTNSSGSTPTPFGFAGAHGYQEDPDSGLKLLGHRYYDPSTGRFLTRDKVKDGRNWYVYCENNPSIGVDPTGLWNPWRWIWTGDGNASDEVYEAALEAAANQLVGRPDVDKEGYPVRIGGTPAILIHRDMAVTPNGTTYLNDEEMWDRYQDSPWWRDHEHQHVWQREQIGPLFIFAIAADYIRNFGHGGGLEDDANNVADNMQSWRARDQNAPHKYYLP